MEERELKGKKKRGRKKKNFSLNSFLKCKRIEGHACVVRRVGVGAAGRLGFGGWWAAGGIEAVRRK